MACACDEDIGIDTSNNIVLSYSQCPPEELSSKGMQRQLNIWFMTLIILKTSYIAILIF